MSEVKLMHGDCIETMRGMEADSVDSIVTDPPYGLGFMGKKWDALPPSLEVFTECLRVLKPGGHLLAFGGSRTYHRLAVAVEDAGFEIRDQIMWVYGSGFPKSQNVSKAIDKASGAEREVVGQKWADRYPNGPGGNSFSVGDNPDGKRTAANTLETAPSTDAAKQWDGWGTALKPAHEPIVMARKPLTKGNTIAANVMEYGTGAINIDGCRVPTEGGDEVSNHGRKATANGWDPRMSGGQEAGQTDGQKLGRFPANLIHDGSDEVVGLFPVTTTGKVASHSTKGMWGSGEDTSYSDSEKGGSAARFFYQAKANKRDRGEGNNHPTVKPTDLMRYLCRMVTPPGGTVLDPFMGSGSTGKAAKMEGFGFVGIEMDADYLAIAESRIQ